MATTLIPGLDDDIAYQCLLRSSLHCHSEMRKVSRAWRKAVGSSKFYANRAAQGCDQDWLVAATNCGLMAFNPSAAVAWIHLPRPPDRHGLGGFQCKVLGHKIYLLGGYASFNAQDAVSVFDTHTNEWSSAASMLVPRAHFASAVAGGRLYVAGGAHSGQGYSCEVYDPVEDRWHPLPPAPQSIAFYNAVAVNGGIVFASRGGAGRPMFLPVSGEDRSWRLLDGSFQALSGCSCLFTHCNQIYLLPGNGVSCQRLSNDTNSWIMPCAEYLSEYYCAVSCRGDIWAVTAHCDVAVMQVDGCRLETKAVYKLGLKMRNLGSFQCDVVKA